MTSYLWTSIQNFQVAKPYDSILLKILKKKSKIIKQKEQMYLSRVNKKIQAFKIDYKGEGLYKVHKPKYKIKKQFKNYTLFEVIT